MHLVIVTGLSGSGKSVALNIMEDSGYYCVDNLPAQLLSDTIKFLETEDYKKVAISVDIRSGKNIPIALSYVETLKGKPTKYDIIFLDAKNEVLIQRFSETRRKHPLSNKLMDLSECINVERKILANIPTPSHIIDTTNLNPTQLKLYLRQFIKEGTFKTMLLFKSFGFKYGLPPEADFVFDIRCLKNPHYDRKLRRLTGKEKPVIEFLDSDSEVQKMSDDIKSFLTVWIPRFFEDSRNYLTIAIGCTGGWHRSVYLTEKLSKHFDKTMLVTTRHRELD